MTSNIYLYFRVIVDDVHAKQLDQYLNKISDKNARNYKIRNLYAWLKINPNVLLTNEVSEIIHWEESVWRMGTNIGDTWQKERLKYFPEVEEELIMEGQSLLQCPKCKEYKVDFYTKQTRGADEPETIFARCTLPACGHRWRS
jgi:DNA-directed RNA polymerase subunit M/transcription elongation factor TFIIS